MLRDQFYFLGHAKCLIRTNSDVDGNSERDKETGLKWVSQNINEYAKNKHTAMVLIPLKSVTVADPPRISIDETIMFVLKLFMSRQNDTSENEHIACNGVERRTRKT